MLATFRGVYIIEIVHMGSVLTSMSFIHDMIHSHVRFIFIKKHKTVVLVFDLLFIPVYMI